MSRNKQIKVMIVMECGLGNPSAMVAGLQYKELFEQHQGYSVTFENRLPEFPYLVKRILHLGRMMRLSSSIDHVDALHQRYHEDRLVEHANDCDVVYAIKIPSLRFYERLKRLNKPRILTCFADGLWLPYFRRAGWQDLEDILRISDGVTCESEYMARFVRQFNQRIFTVHDSPQVESFDLWRSQVKHDPERVIIGWVGSPSTVTALYKILEPLEELFSRHSNLLLRIIGADQAYLPRFEKVVWSSIPAYNQQKMIREVLQMDIGLFPLFNVEESLARGTLKPMIYMSGEVAAICQDLGDSQKLIVDGTNGMLASSSGEWLEKLDWLVTHEKERKRIAGNGLATIRRRFTREKCFAQLTTAIESIV